MAFVRVSNWLRSAADVVLPRRCSACGTALTGDERYLCRPCLMELPRTRFEAIDFNLFEQRFAGMVPVERAVSYFYYERHSPYAAILHDIKYHGMPQLGVWMGERAAEAMAPSGCFDGVDLLVPVPLHFTKLADRGYNQSERIATGVARKLGVPVVDALKALHATTTQTHKTAQQRFAGKEGLFAVKSKHTATLAGKHILLVDDVVTTGATLMACARAIKAVPSTTLSLFTLAAAHLD